MQEKKSLAYVIVALIIAALLGWWLFGGKGGIGTGGSATQETVSPKPVPPTVTAEVKLTPQEKSGDVSAKKAEILALVRSGTPLTTEQKQEITLIMATKANIYKFSEEERQAIFAAFNRK